MTTQQTALQLAARHLVEAQEQVAVSMRGTDVAERRMLWEKIGPLETTLNSLGRALEAAGATYQPKYPDLADHPMIFIDPKINFGMPSVRGKAIRADVLSGPARAGDTAEAVAEWYEIPVEQVYAAVRWAKACETANCPQADPHGLGALRKIEESRTQGRVLLQVLEEALIRAEALDKKRGNWVGDMANTAQGETPGTDYAEAVQALLLRLQGELGAEGSGRE